MKKLNNEKLILILGVSVPIFVILFFLIATKLPQIITDPPKYSFLFTVDDYYNRSNENVRIYVSEEKLVAKYQTLQNAHAYFIRTRLYLFDAEKQDVREIPITPPSTPKDESEKWYPFQIPELANLRINTLATSPDGYKLETDYNYSGGLVQEIFWGSPRKRSLTLSKNGSSVRILKTDNNYSQYNIKFLGWIIPE
jgi:hypothetical protein